MTPGNRQVGDLRGAKSGGGVARNALCGREMRVGEHLLYPLPAPPREGVFCGLIRSQRGEKRDAAGRETGRSLVPT